MAYKFKKGDEVAVIAYKCDRLAYIDTLFKKYVTTTDGHKWDYDGHVYPRAKRVAWWGRHIEPATDQHRGHLERARYFGAIRDWVHTLNMDDDKVKTSTLKKIADIIRKEMSGKAKK